MHLQHPLIEMQHLIFLMINLNHFQYKVQHQLNLIRFFLLFYYQIKTIIKLQFHVPFCLHHKPMSTFVICSSMTYMEYYYPALVELTFEIPCCYSLLLSPSLCYHEKFVYTGIIISQCTQYTILILAPPNVCKYCICSKVNKSYKSL